MVRRRQSQREELQPFNAWGKKKIRQRRRERFPGLTTKWMRSKRNSTDLSLWYYLQMFLQRSFNEAKPESTTVKNLAVGIFAKHCVRKKIFCSRSHTSDPPNEIMTVGLDFTFTISHAKSWLSLV